MELIHGDCLEEMKKMPDKLVDLVLTDPPYGINIASNGQIGGNKPFGSKGSKDRGTKLCGLTRYGKQTWDKKIPSKEIFDEIYRVSKNQIIFGGNYMVEHLYNSPCWIVWDKDNSGNFADCELAWTSFKTAVRKIKYRWNGMLQGNMQEKEKRCHPTQKPAPVMRWILRNYSIKNNLILDPFMGSGTTGVACKEEDRDFIGIEINKEYYEIAEKRLKNTQKSLF